MRLLTKLSLFSIESYHHLHTYDRMKYNAHTRPRDDISGTTPCPYMGEHFSAVNCKNCSSPDRMLRLVRTIHFAPHRPFSIRAHASCPLSDLMASGGERFADEGVTSFGQLLFDLDRDQLFVGARWGWKIFAAVIRRFCIWTWFFSAMFDYRIINGFISKCTDENDVV